MQTIIKHIGQIALGSFATAIAKLNPNFSAQTYPRPIREAAKGPCFCRKIARDWPSVSAILPQESAEDLLELK
ncbi:MAG: hypothetical protein AAF468_10345 [Pseudomonadota bacterium]